MALRIHAEIVRLLGFVRCLSLLQLIDDESTQDLFVLRIDYHGGLDRQGRS